MKRSRERELVPDNGKAEVRAHQAARQHRHHGSHRPWQDDADRRDHQGPVRAHPGLGLHALRPDRQGPRRAPARHHHLHRPRGVRDGEPPLRPRRHARPRRLRQEHDHRRRPGRRRHPGRLGHRRPHAPDPRARAARAPGGRALHRRRPQQGGHGGRRGAPRARRDGGPRAADRVRLPRRRHPDRARLGAEGPRGRRRLGRQDHRAHGRGGQLHPRARARHRQAVPDVDRGRHVHHRAAAPS